MKGGSQSTADIDDRLLTSLRREFFEDALDELSHWEALLLDFERSGDSAVLLDLRRRMHSMKGSAMTLGLGEAGTLLHLLEERFGQWFPAEVATGGESRERSEPVGRLLELVDGLRSFYQAHENGEDAAATTRELRLRLSA